MIHTFIPITCISFILIPIAFYYIRRNIRLNLIYTMSQKFCNILVNMRQNLSVLDAFAKIMKVTNHTEQWDELTWYSQNANPLIVSTTWRMPLESMLLHLPDFAWLSKFLWNFLNLLFTVQWSNAKQMQFHLVHKITVIFCTKNTLSCSAKQMHFQLLQNKCTLTFCATNALSTFAKQIHLYFLCNKCTFNFAKQMHFYLLHNKCTFNFSTTNALSSSVLQIYFQLLPNKCTCTFYATNALPPFA